MPRNGVNPLQYTGVIAPNPPNLNVERRNPRTSDYTAYRIGELWLNAVNQTYWVLTSKAAQVATWTQLSTGQNELQTLTGNSGGAVSADVNQNINFVGTDTITVVGNPGSNTLTITPSGDIADSFSTDAGIATPVVGVLTIAGGSNIGTTGAGSTVTVNLDNTVSISGSFTAGTGITSTTGNIVATAGNVVITAGNLTLPDTNTAATEGIIIFGGTRFVSNYGTQNTFVGENSGNTSLTVLNAIFNTGVGFGTLQSLTTGSDNTALGNGALLAATDGSENVGVGGLTLNDLTTGDENTAVGAAAAEHITTGSQNTAVGWAALTGPGAAGLLTGTFNVGIGYAAGGNYTGAESNNILISSSGTVGESNTLRIANGTGAGQQQVNRAFIHGIRGITTGVADAIAVLVDSAGQLGTVSSSMRYKQDIRDMNEYSEALLGLRPVLFSYKQDKSETLQRGLIAEEVEKVFPDLVVYKDGLPESIKYHELPILLLNELKKQHAITQYLLDRFEILEEALQEK